MYVLCIRRPLYNGLFVFPNDFDRVLKGDCITACSGPRLAETGPESGAPARAWLKTVLKTVLKAVLRAAFGVKTVNTNKNV